MSMSRCAAVCTLALALSACAGPVEPDEALYDTWVDPHQGGEVIFHRDLTISWFGIDGTWEVREDSSLGRCLSWGGCDKEIRIAIPGHTFSVPYKSRYLENQPNTLFLAPSRNGGEVTVPIYTIPGCYVTLYRQGSFSPDLMPSHFESMEESLPTEDIFDQKTINYHRPKNGR